MSKTGQRSKSSFLGHSSRVGFYWQDEHRPLVCDFEKITRGSQMLSQRCGGGVSLGTDREYRRGRLDFDALNPRIVLQVASACESQNSRQ